MRAPGSNHIQAVSEYGNRYERLRRQALESSGTPDRLGLELAFVERQGLAAWMEHGVDDPAVGADSADQQTCGSGETEPLQRDLIVILADLVLGNRQEEQDERAN